MRLFIEPTDVWLFRDGKPFDAGSDHRARSLFPPNPTTLQGALRGKLFAMAGVSREDFVDQREVQAQVLAQKIGKPGEPPPFALRGPYLARREENGRIVCYLPLPADVVRVGDELRVLQPLKETPFTFNEPLAACRRTLSRAAPRSPLFGGLESPPDVLSDNLLGMGKSLRPLWTKTDKPSKEARGWLDVGSLRACLNGQAPLPRRIKRDAEFFTHESRFGVGIESGIKRPQEGLLYQVEFIRPRDNVGLAVEVVGEIYLPEPGMLALGGELRAARYEKRAFELPDVCRPESDRFKVYFATPAYFDKGWQSADWNKRLDGDVTLVAAAVGRAQSLGGWDVANNWHKPMRRYVPAGSVFYFQANGRVEYNGQPVTDDESDGKIGYGQVLFGTWDYLDAQGGQNV